MSSNSHIQPTQPQLNKTQQQHHLQQPLQKSKMPINHQHLLGLQAVGLMPRQFANMGGNLRPQKRKRELKCPHCPSTFISNNNLRRHLFELHKNEMGYLPEPPRIECDLPNMCRKCNVKFETKAEWIEHKVAEARVMKPFGPFQWGCDLCGAYVSRKEKLINHLHNHMKEQVIVPVEHPESNKQSQQRPKQTETQELLQQQTAVQAQGQQQQQQTEGNDVMPEFKKIKIPSLPQKIDGDDESRDSGKEQYDEDDEEDDDDEGDVEAEVDNNDNEVELKVEQYDEIEEEEAVEGEEFDDLAVGAQQTVGGDEDVDDDDDDDEEEDDEDDDDSSDADDEDPSTNEDTNEASSFKGKSTTDLAQPRSYNDTENDDVEEEDDSDEFDDEDNSSTENRKQPSSSSVVTNVVVKSRYSCDLCQVYFDSQQELQKHVKMHFLNGPGSVTLTEIKSSKSSSNKSRSSSSDVVTV